MEYQLRRVNNGDRQLLYEWATDKTVRENSFCMGEISVSEHIAWFEKHMMKEQCDMFILEFNGEPIGQARIDWVGEKGEISYSIAVGYRGQGHGAKLLQMVENKLAGRGMWLSAKVKKENIASCLIFENLGYMKKNEENYFLYTKHAMHLHQTSEN